MALFLKMIKTLIQSQAFQIWGGIKIKKQQRLHHLRESVAIIQFKDNMLLLFFKIHFSSCVNFFKKGIGINK